MGPSMDGTIDGVNEVAQTVLGTEVVVLLAAVIVFMSIGIVAILWYFGRAFAKATDGQIEQIKLFNNALGEAGNLNTQLLTANSQNVDTLDKLGDQIVIIGDALQNQQAFFNQAIVLLQTQDQNIHNAIEVAQTEHAEIVDRVDEMNERMDKIIAAIEDMQRKITVIEEQTNILCQSDADTDVQIQALIAQLAELNEKVGILITELTNEKNNNESLE